MEDHAYLKICADLASCLTISIASARRKIDLAASREGIKDLSSRKLLAEKILQKARDLSNSDKEATAIHLDELLVALAHEENFMTED